MQIGGNDPLANGIMTVIATDAAHDPINYSVPSIGTGLMKPWIVPVVAGALTRTLCLPRTDKTSTPAAYHINIRDTSPQGGNRFVMDVYDVPIVTDTWSLDTYSFLPATNPYTLNVYPYTGTGLEELTGDVTAIGIGTANATVNAIHGTVVPLSSAADQVLLTTSPGASTWTSIPNCASDGLHELTYSTSTHSLACTVAAAITPTGVCGGSSTCTVSAGGIVYSLTNAGQVISVGNPFAVGISCTAAATFEIGYISSSPNTCTLSYANGTATSASISDGTHTVALTGSLSSGNLAFAYGTNTTFTATASTGSQSASASTGIAFYPYTFGGVGTAGATGATYGGSGSGETAVLTGATGTLSNAGFNNQSTYGPYCPSGQKIYVLMIGTGHTFTSGGFAFGMNTPTAITFTDQFGGGINYEAYESVNTLNACFILAAN